MRRVFVHAFVESCSPLETGGIFKVALLFVIKSLMLKPLSAMQSSLGHNVSMRPGCIVMFLSETPPDHSFETNVKAPVGEIPTKSLKVFELL